MRRLVLAGCALVTMVAVVTARPMSVHACSCTAFDPVAELARADAVFVGEAVEVRTAPPGDPMAAERRYIFDVQDVYKGDVPQVQSVVSAVDSSACGLPWDQAGAIAVVFGSNTGAATMIPGELSASSCTTYPLGPTSILPEFGPARAPLDAASPVGIPPPAPPPGDEGAHLSWEWIALGALVAVGAAVGVWPRRHARLDS